MIVTLEKIMKCHRYKLRKIMVAVSTWWTRDLLDSTWTSNCLSSRNDFIVHKYCGVLMWISLKIRLLCHTVSKACSMSRVTMAVDLLTLQNFFYTVCHSENLVKAWVTPSESKLPIIDNTIILHVLFQPHQDQSFIHFINRWKKANWSVMFRIIRVFVGLLEAHDLSYLPSFWEEIVRWINKLSRQPLCLEYVW